MNFLINLCGLCFVASTTFKKKSSSLPVATRVEVLKEKEDVLLELFILYYFNHVDHLNLNQMGMLS